MEECHKDLSYSTFSTWKKRSLLDPEITGVHCRRAFKQTEIIDAFEQQLFEAVTNSLNDIQDVVGLTLELKFRRARILKMKLEYRIYKQTLKRDYKKEKKIQSQITSFFKEKQNKKVSILISKFDDFKKCFGILPKTTLFWVTPVVEISI